MKLELNMNLIIKIVIPLLLVSLFGCGGSDDGGVTEGNTPAQKISINAQDELKFTQLNTKTTIDLRQRVHAQNNESLLISNVKSINGDCDILSIDGLSFDIYSRNVDVCRFEYSVTPASDNYTGSAKAVAQIVANEESTQYQYLSPISRTIQINKSISFNTSDLGIENGYVLDPQSVAVLNGTGTGTDETGELANISESGFDYTAPNTETIVRIFYSVINITDNIVKPGIIYIAIGQNTNINPSVSDRTLENSILTNGDRTINISSFVSDGDQDELQLIYARGIIGNVDITGNLEFQHKSSTTGHEYITYIVSDHNGGYGIGLLDFSILLYEQISDSSQELIFMPPMTKNSPELVTSSDLYYEVGINGFEGYYPVFTQSLASSYCATMGGRLPTENELTTMWNGILKEPVFNTYKWQSGKPYLTSEIDRQVSLINGRAQRLQDEAYFSCVKSTKDIEWEFSQASLTTTLGSVVSIVEIAKDPLTDNTIYRDPKDFQLHATVKSYTLNGENQEFDDIVITIDKGSMVIDAPGISEKDNPYISIELTDDGLPGKKMYVNIGISICPKGTTPQEALRKSCISLFKGITFKLNFTMPIPMSILGLPPSDISNPKIIGENGAAYIGIKNANNDAWYRYVQKACDLLNSIKADGYSNWRSWRTLPDPHFGKDSLNAEDAAVARAFREYLMEMDPNPTNGAYDYDIGFSLEKNNKNVLKFLHDRILNEIVQRPQDTTYVYASCTR
ncbi:TPA: hypothetical protein ACX6PX_000470 [Photobacterium damselae]